MYFSLQVLVIGHGNFIFWLQVPIISVEKLAFYFYRSLLMKELEACSDVGVGITLPLHGLFISKKFFAYYLFSDSSLEV